MSQEFSPLALLGRTVNDAPVEISLATVSGGELQERLGFGLIWVRGWSAQHESLTIEAAL